MLATLIIVFREVIEAGLIIGIVLSATEGVRNRARWIFAGSAGGILGACVVALFADSIANQMEGTGQELFNAAVMTIAVAMLTAHNVWMARSGRQLGIEARSLGQDVADGSRTLIALATVVGVALLREGSEVALFLYGIALSESDGNGQMLLGGALGLGLGGVVSACMYFGLLRIPPRHLFAVTSRLIALLAAGMAAQAAVYLQQSGWITALPRVVWDTSHVLSESSIPGRALHSLIGYADRPTALQLLVYLATLCGIFVLMRLFGSTAPVKASRA